MKVFATSSDIFQGVNTSQALRRETAAMLKK